MSESIIIRQAIPSLLNNLLNIFSIFFIAIILSTKIGLAFYGEFASIISLVGILFIFGDFGINHLFPKVVPKEINNEKKLSIFFSFFIFLRLIFSIFLFLLIFLVSPYSIFTNSILCLYLLLRMLNPDIFLKCFEENFKNFYINLFSKLILVYLFLNYDYSEDPINFSILILIISLAIQCAFSYLILFQRSKLRILFSRDVIQLMPVASSFYFSRLLFNTYYQGSTYFVSIFLSYELVAIYSIGKDFYRGGQTIIGAVSTTFYVRLNFLKDFNLLKKYTKYILIAMLLFLLPLYFLGERILEITFDFNTLELFKFTIFIYVFSFLSVFNALWGYPFFVTIDKEREINKITLYSSISYYLLLFLIVNFNDLNIYYAASCFLIADFLGFLGRIYYLRVNKEVLNAHHD